MTPITVQRNPRYVNAPFEWGLWGADGKSLGDAFICPRYENKEDGLADRNRIPPWLATYSDGSTREINAFSTNAPLNVQGVPS